MGGGDGRGCGDLVGNEMYYTRCLNSSTNELHQEGPWGKEEEGGRWVNRWGVQGEGYERLFIG